MKPWPEEPVIYEIHTWVWLQELSRRHGHAMDLGTVPASEWDALASWGFDAVWLMGVWQRSPAGVRVAREHPGLLTDYGRALPAFTLADVVGSPYCVRSYQVDDRLGGQAGLATARQALAERGLRLVLDFVPNHVAQDHPWLAEHPEYFIEGKAEDLRTAPTEFFVAQGRVVACGRDPYFPAWTDVAQLNAFAAGLRQALAETVRGIGEQCDGVRCDMAMLLLNQVFERTWGARAGARPSAELWPELISAVRARHPELLFIAETYWDTEWELLQLGFDYCYDKRLYDRLRHGPAEAVRAHLSADHAYQRKLVRFIENHDEERGMAAFGAGKWRAAAFTMCLLPGAKLLHDGQLEGLRIKLPVQLGRRPLHAPDEQARAFYRRLLHVSKECAARGAEWQLCEPATGGSDATSRNVIAWCWRSGARQWLAAVNLSSERSRLSVRLPWDELQARAWRLIDVWSGAMQARGGGELRGSGLPIALDPWGFQLLRLEPQ